MDELVYIFKKAQHQVLLRHPGTGFTTSQEMTNPVRIPLDDLLERRIVILDGALDTMSQALAQFLPPHAVDSEWAAANWPPRPPIQPQAELDNTPAIGGY